MTGEEKLIKLYETAMKELYREIAYREWRGNSASYQRHLLEKVQAVLKQLKKKTPGAVRDALKPAYLAGIQDFIKDTGFTLEPRINWRQLNLLIQNTTDQLTLATNRVGRIWRDAIRRAGIEATQHKLATGQTVNQMRRQLLAELYNINPKGKDGQTGIVTKRGTMRLDTYAALVARSTTAEAQNASKLEMAKEHDYDLVRFTKHSPTCGVCAQYEDRLFALTKEAANGKYKGPNGEALRFPYLYDTAFVSGYNNIHPNCRHRLTIVVSAFLSPEQLADWSRKSMRPFVDNRSERDRKAYAKAQADNRSRWQDRRQWERYRAVLPDQTPANFGAFRVMKRANSEKWKFLNLDYARRKKLTDHPELALPHAEKAWAADAKFTRYLFNQNNPDGWAKGVAITKRLGYDIDSWQALQNRIIESANLYPVTPKGNNGFGDKYEQMIIIYGPNGKPANMKIGWIIAQDTVKMTTCYLEEPKWNE